MDRSAFYSDGVLQLKGGYLEGGLGIDKYDIDFNQDPDLPYDSNLPAGFNPFAPPKPTFFESSLRPETTETTKPDDGTRVSAGGVVQKGLDLDAVNALFKSQSEKGMMSAGGLGNSSKYLSAALPTTEGTKPSASTTPYKTGGTPSDPQDGTSPKPDRVERLRQIGFNGADFSGDEPDDSTLVSPMYANKERNAARAAFLDPNNKGYNAIRARDRAVGAFHQYDTGGVMIDGEIQEFNKGMSRDARFELSGGLNSAEQAQKFKDKYLKAVVADTGETGTTPTTTTETPSTTTTTTEVETPDTDTSTFKPIWTTKAVPDKGAPAGGWDKHFADMEKNHRL